METFKTPVGNFRVGPCRSSIVTVLSENGQSKIPDPEARLTGKWNVANVRHNGEKDIELEVSHSFGTSWIISDYIFQ